MIDLLVLMIGFLAGAIVGGRVSYEILKERKVEKPTRVNRSSDSGAT